MNNSKKAHDVRWFDLSCYDYVISLAQQGEELLRLSCHADTLPCLDVTEGSFVTKHLFDGCGWFSSGNLCRLLRWECFCLASLPAGNRVWTAVHATTLHPQNKKESSLYYCHPENFTEASKTDLAGSETAPAFGTLGILCTQTHKINLR